MIIDLLAETGVNPKNLGIELTEGSLINIGQDIVQKIMTLRKSGLDVIAEGVETEEELRYLNSRGCMVYQGYYFSRPVEIDVFTTMLELGSSAQYVPPLLLRVHSVTVLTNEELRYTFARLV